MVKPAAQLQCVANFRDVGQSVNDFLGQKRVREGFIFRSARPDDASAKDKLRIKNEFGIKTIIDLRTKTELIKQAEKVQAETSGNAFSSWFSSRPSLPRIDGINYEEIRITGRPFERHLFSQLSWWSFFKVIFLFIFGYRIEAVRLIATEVMLQRGLLGLGIDTIDHSGSEICQALGLYTSPSTLPVLVHCTQGKDRTGLICILILMILDIPLGAIEHDYFLTDPALEAQRHERLAEIRQIGLTDDWAVTAPELVIGVQKHLDVEYGGLEAYLDDIGFGEIQRAQLRELLLY
ncbi:tyrosine/serine protein phosphatase [Metarhizium robertsii ARSEF 23]|uniref:Tyrosine/serine protein phosphatase n=1 Tax=Metarhizium robertsii (strain ARSEF 23 / ATCC MYA-3075) TaxID=655844 RepID=E9F3Q1_METRA|nr:tyrosine/serine protein phosphatase [Metarhizium robertsii ARSEF 23]EFY97587.2 tyrosine/serine protein phosphatase [Metarhizium robertsii ARSEF 23]